jgi:hypothetical protein
MSTFYRAISLAERDDIRRTGRLRAGPNGCEGKHLAHSADAARAWGWLLFGPEPHAIIRVMIPDAVAARLYSWPRLDGIGPASFATIEELEGAVVEEVPDEP